jgi:Uma2 family endonuclease
MTTSIEELIRQADHIGVRLEIVNGKPIWEASPVYRHQREALRIQQSLINKNESSCACHGVLDVIFKFPDGSFKRPDVAILCRVPDESEIDAALEIMPEAVVEIVSENYEYKDEIAPDFYLEQGVKDIIVFNPRTLEVIYYSKQGVARFKSPTHFDLECGCHIEV